MRLAEALADPVALAERIRYFRNQKLSDEWITSYLRGDGVPQAEIDAAFKLLGGKAGLSTGAKVGIGLAAGLGLLLAARKARK